MNLEVYTFARDGEVGEELVLEKALESAGYSGRHLRHLQGDVM